MNYENLEQLFYESKPYLTLGVAFATMVFCDVSGKGYAWCALLLGLSAFIVYQRKRYRNQ